MIQAIEIKNLSYRYRDDERNVLNEVSLTIKNNSIVSILGNNGSGKTSLLMLLLGKLLPKSGKIEYLHSTTEKEEKAKIGYLPQIEEIPFGFSVEEYVMMGRFPLVGRFHIPDETDREQTRRTLEGLGILELKTKKLQEVSGGELQKVRIARLLIQKPDIFLMDEPANHLDLKNRAELLKIIKKMINDKKIIIFTTHEPHDSLEIADQVLMLKEGETIAFGSTHEVFNESNLEKTFGLAIRLFKVDERTVLISGD